MMISASLNQVLCVFLLRILITGNLFIFCSTVEETDQTTISNEPQTLINPPSANSGTILDLLHVRKIDKTPDDGPILAELSSSENKSNGDDDERVLEYDAQDNSGEEEEEEATASDLIKTYHNKGAIVCYYGSWATYRKNGGKFSIDMIDPFLCTHIIYSFTGLKNNEITLLDPWCDLEDQRGLGSMMKLTKMKLKNPNLKTLVAIGGWNEGSANYSKMAASDESRKKFVQSVINLLGKFNFDGLDVDWEYPSDRGGDKADKVNFIKLLRDLRDSFKQKKYLLSCAVGADRKNIDSGYDVPQMVKYVDMINLMAYDFHGSWETKTGVPSPLYRSEQHDSSAKTREYNVDSAVKYWIQKGAKPGKIILGLGFYGKSFTLADGSKNGINAPASKGGSEGPYTKAEGTLSYLEVCESLKNESSAWTVVRDPNYKVPYAYNRNKRQWVGYEDRESIKVKTRYAKSKGLGGVMMWSIDMDDFDGRCHGEKFPLLNSIKKAFDEPVAGSGGSGGAGGKDGEPAEPEGGGNSDGDSKCSCKAEGLFVNPSRCSQFFVCIKSSGKSNYSMTSFTCSKGTCFNKKSNLCA